MQGWNQAPVSKFLTVDGNTKSLGFWRGAFMDSIAGAAPPPGYGPTGKKD
jgi:hypothetical protein